MIYILLCLLTTFYTIHNCTDLCIVYKLMNQPRTQSKIYCRTQSVISCRTKSMIYCKAQSMIYCRTQSMIHCRAQSMIYSSPVVEQSMHVPLWSTGCCTRSNLPSFLWQVLLSLNDDDLELGLGVNSTMHRRKLRLAIEDYREAENGKGVKAGFGDWLSKASELDHHWVAKAWLNDVGLLQYSQAFHNHLVDGRVLNSLTKRDLEKYLNVSKKFHQISLLLAIELFRQWDFDRE
eukprot:g32518.t1